MVKNGYKLVIQNGTISNNIGNYRGPLDVGNI